MLLIATLNSNISVIEFDLYHLLPYQLRQQTLIYLLALMFSSIVLELKNFLELL